MTTLPSNQPDAIDNRRAHRRLQLRLPIDLRRTGEGSAVLVRTVTQNISTGGMYLELDRPDLAVGDRIDVQLTVPPTEGVSPYPGKASCAAEVLRVSQLPSVRDEAIERHGIAARFLDRLRFNY